MSSILLNFEVPSLPFRALRQLASQCDDGVLGIREFLHWGRQEADFGTLIFKLTGVDQQYLSGPSEPTSLEKIGISALRRRLGMLSLKQWNYSELTAYGLTSIQFQHRCLSSALWAENIAEKTQGPTGDAFLLGLFSQLGMVPISRLLDRVRPGARIGVESFSLFPNRLSWERESAGQDSLQTAATLAEKWDFPDWLGPALRGLRQPLLVSNARPIAMIGHLAVQFSTMLDSGNYTIPFNRTTMKCLEAISLHPSAIAGMYREIAGLIRDFQEEEAPDRIAS